MFDDWASTFGEVVTQLEMNPAGNGYRMKSRFSKFVNIPELMQMYKEFADIQTADMFEELRKGKKDLLLQVQVNWEPELIFRTEYVQFITWIFHGVRLYSQNARGN